MTTSTEPKKWWQTLPAILTGIATVITATTLLIPALQGLIGEVESITDQETIETTKDDTEDPEAGILQEVDQNPMATPPLEQTVAVAAEATYEPGTGPIDASPATEPDADDAGSPVVALLPTEPPAIEDVPPPCDPCRGTLRFKTQDGSPDQIVLAFTDVDPSELVKSPNPDDLILEKFTFSGRRHWLRKSVEKELTISDPGFLGARHVVLYNEGKNGWDGWVQLTVDDEVVVDQQIPRDVKHFRRPEMSTHYYWWETLNPETVAAAP